MKKLLLLSMLAMSGFITSCGEEDPEPKVEAIDPAATHEGRWNTARAQVVVKDQNWNTSGPSKDETVGSGVHVIELSGQGAYKETYNGSTTTGTYVKDNNKLTLTIPQRLLINSGKHYIDSLTTNRMVIRDTVVNNGLYTITTLTFKR